MGKNIAWFKNEFIPLISKEYKMEYSSFEEGDFGNIERAEFEGINKGGYVDFYSSGWLNIHIIDTKNWKDLINVLLEPVQSDDIDKAFEELELLLR